MFKTKTQVHMEWQNIVYWNLRGVCTNVFLLQIVKSRPRKIKWPRDNIYLGHSPDQRTASSGLCPGTAGGARQPESSASLSVCDPWGLVCCRLGLLLPQPHGWYYLANCGFFYFFTLLSSNPCFQSYHSADPYENCFQEESVGNRLSS